MYQYNIYYSNGFCASQKKFIAVRVCMYVKSRILPIQSNGEFNYYRKNGLITLHYTS
ncbi:MAG: hypothetical protein ACI8RD_014311 [Bacillariaceae sp.]|jgi:hypothetical protein